jgi:gluconolactonase
MVAARATFRLFAQERLHRQRRNERWRANHNRHGERFNGPNDIVGKSDGAIYSTDTVWGLRGAEKSPDRELPYSGFFLIKDGKVTLLGGDKDNPGNGPNGIALSPDEKHLYVTAGSSKTMRYDVPPDDTVANPVKFLDAGNDGIKVDRNGNVVFDGAGQ